jgi:radical SAM superfamily enzyme YgiQ (UPF0313 family)
MKIHLINPAMPLSFLSNEYGAPMVLRKYSTPPLGLLTAAGMIPSHHRVTLCDENTSQIDWNVDCDVVGITGMHLQEPRIREIAARFRARGKVVVVGGPSVMSLPEKYRDVADIRIVGEAEAIWPQCLADLERGSYLNEYVAVETVELSTSPIPRFDLISPKDYLSVSLQTTRGCPFRCEFCDIITLYGRKVRVKPVDQVLREVQRVLDLGWDRMVFVDDNMIGDPRYATELMQALADLRRRAPKPFYFTTQVTINLAQNTRMMELLYEAGGRSVFIGIETPRTSSLQETLKFQNVRRDLLGEVERIQRHGIAVYSGLIVGFDHDDLDIFKEQIAFITDAKIPIPLPSILGALPGTPLYKRMEDEGRLIPDKEFQANAYFTNIIPKSMTTDELERGYREMVFALYDPVRFADRVIGEIARLDDAEGQVSNYRMPIVWAAFVWVFVWYLFDPNRGKLLTALSRIVPAVLTRFPRMGDAALQRLVIYRHICRFVSMLEQRHAARPTEVVGSPALDAARASNLA